MTVPIVSTLMDPIEESVRENFFPMIFGGEEVDNDFRKILGHSIKCGGLYIPDPWLSEDSAYNISKAVCGELVGSLLGGTKFNYIGLRACIYRASVEMRKEMDYSKMAGLARQKYLAGVQESQCLHTITINRV